VLNLYLYFIWGKVFRLKSGCAGGLAKRYKEKNLQAQRNKHQKMKVMGLIRDRTGDLLQSELSPKQEFYHWTIRPRRFFWADFSYLQSNNLWLLKQRTPLFVLRERNSVYTVNHQYLNPKSKIQNPKSKIQKAMVSLLGPGLLISGSIPVILVLYDLAHIVTSFQHLFFSKVQI